MHKWCFVSRDKTTCGLYNDIPEALLRATGPTLVCVDVNTGMEVWRKDVSEELGEFIGSTIAAAADALLHILPTYMSIIEDIRRNCSPDHISLQHRALVELVSCLGYVCSVDPNLCVWQQACSVHSWYEAARCCAVDAGIPGLELREIDLVCTVQP